MTDVPRKAVKTVGVVVATPFRIAGKVLTGVGRRITGRGSRPTGRGRR